MLQTAAPTTKLSPCELQALKLVADGATAAEAAAEARCATRTIYFHLQNAYEKLGVRNRVAALSVARRWGILQ